MKRLSSQLKLAVLFYAMIAAEPRIPLISNRGSVNSQQRSKQTDFLDGDMPRQRD
jgi:hypothetical protein